MQLPAHFFINGVVFFYVILTYISAADKFSISAVDISVDDVKKEKLYVTTTSTFNRRSLLYIAFFI